MTTQKFAKRLWNSGESQEVFQGLGVRYKSSSSAVQTPGFELLLKARLQALDIHLVLGPGNKDTRSKW